MRTLDRRLVRSLLWLLVSFAASAPVSAFAGYREATLENGLHVVLIEHRSNPMVASSVVVGAGVVHEGEGQSGASHLLEHLLFNGTTTRTQRQLYDEVDRYGAYNNATTREDHTLFTLLIQKEYAEKGLDIQADMLFRSTVPEENFAKEKEIVLEEMARDATDPATRSADRFREFAFAGTPLARPVLGSVESIRAMTRESVVAYYRSRYVPSNMVLVVMGDFETDSMLAAVRRTFGAAPKAAVVPRETGGGWPPAPEGNLATFALDAPATTVHAAFPLDLAAHDPRCAAIELLLAALSDGEDAPLRRALTGGAEPLATDVSVSLGRRTGPWSTVEVQVSLAPGKPHLPVLRAVADGLRDLGPASPARSRLEIVRARVRAREILEADQIHYFALTHSDALLGSPAGWLARVENRFDDVSAEEIDRAAMVLASGVGRLRVGVSGPSLAAGTSRWEAPAFAPPERGSTRPRVERTLPSGLRAVVERNDDSRVFAVHVLLRPRSASEPAGKEGIASFLHRMFPRGTAGMDAAALSVRLARLGASLKTDDDPRVPYDDYATTPEFSFVRIEAPADGWRETLSVLGEILLRPRLAADDAAAVRDEMLDLQARRKTSSRNRAASAIDGRLAPGHPLSRPVLGTPESVASITVEDLRAFHRAYVTGRRAIVTVVSPVDPGEVLSALESAFRELPEGAPLPDVGAVPLTAPGAERRIPAELPDQVTLALSYVLDAKDEERPALEVLGAMLSDDLAFELREKRGLAYSIGASVTPWGGRTRVSITMGTRKENVDEALRGLLDGVAGFRPKDEEAVRRAAAALRGRMLMRRLTRINQAYFLGLEVLSGRPGENAKTALDALLSVDLHAVAEAAGRHLDPGRFVIVVE